MAQAQIRIMSLAAALAVAGTAAQAADMPVKYKAPVVAAVYDWTGFYIGVNAGIGLGRDLTSISVAPGNLTEVHQPLPFGGLGGAQVGYNWQAARLGASSLVLGVEADIQGTGMDDNRICVVNVFC